MKAVFKYIGTVLFIGLLLIKTSAFHVYEHHDDKEHDNPCELCLLLVASQQAETISLTFDSVQENVLLTQYQGKITASNLQIISGPLETDLFSRPPPSLFS